jgi:STE24 endopeptidase
MSTLRTVEDSDMTITTTATYRESIGERSETREGHPGIWRVLTASPAMTGSALLLVLLLGWMGPWEVAALAAWLVCSALVATRIGEHAAVTVALGFRRPTPKQTAALNSVWSAALLRAELSNGDVHLYVHRASEPNAYAAGTRSVAVTRGLLQQFAARRLTEDQMQALLLHELGHHATSATKGVLPAAWLALPWRLASHLVLAFVSKAARGTQSSRSFLIVVLAGVTVAVLQAVQQHNWPVAFVLRTVSFCAIACPTADAALARRSEYAADRYAHALGYGQQLASALRILGDGRGPRATLTARVLRRHPSTSRRIRALDSSRESAPLTGVAGSNTGCA